MGCCTCGLRACALFVLGLLLAPRGSESMRNFPAALKMRATSGRAPNNGGGW